MTRFATITPRTQYGRRAARPRHLTLREYPGFAVASSLIREVTGGVVRSAEAFGDRCDIELFPEEERSVVSATLERLNEFRTVRACAREAFAQLGIAPSPIPVAAGGAPSWPAGVVGSMTHCRGYRAAAVAKGVDVLALGIDAEQDLPLPDGVSSVVGSSVERASLAALSGPHAWDRLLFSAKESLYKAWFQMTSTPFPYDEATVRIEPLGYFIAELSGSARQAVGQKLVGRWTAGRRLLVTSVVIVARQENGSA